MISLEEIGWFANEPVEEVCVDSKETVAKFGGAIAIVRDRPIKRSLWVHIADHTFEEAE